MNKIFVVIFILTALWSGLPAQEAKSLLTQADSVFNSGAYDQSREIFLKTVTQAKVENDITTLTEANAMIARTYLLEENQTEGIRYLTETVETATPNDPVAWSRYLGVRGRFEWSGKNLLKATDTFKEMFYYCQEHKLWDRAVDAAHMVAITGTLEEQVEWGLKGIAMGEEHDIGRWLGPLYNNLGATYEDRENYPGALEAYIEARKYHYEYGSERNKLIADWAVGHAYRLNDSLDQADSVLTPLVEWSERLNNTEFLGWTMKELGEIEVKRRNYDQAVEYLSGALKNLGEAGMKEWDHAQYKELAEKLETAKIQASYLRNKD